MLKKPLKKAVEKKKQLDFEISFQHEKNLKFVFDVHFESTQGEKFRTKHPDFVKKFLISRWRRPKQTETNNKTPVMHRDIIRLQLEAEFEHLLSPW